MLSDNAQPETEDFLLVDTPEEQDDCNAELVTIVFFLKEGLIPHFSKRVLRSDYEILLRITLPNQPSPYKFVSITDHTGIHTVPLNNVALIIMQTEEQVNALNAANESRQIQNKLTQGITH